MVNRTVSDQRSLLTGRPRLMSSHSSATGRRQRRSQSPQFRRTCAGPSEVGHVAAIRLWRHHGRSTDSPPESWCMALRHPGGGAGPIWPKAPNTNDLFRVPPVIEDGIAMGHSDILDEQDLPRDSLFLACQARPRSDTVCASSSDPPRTGRSAPEVVGQVPKCHELFAVVPGGGGGHRAGHHGRSRLA